MRPALKLTIKVLALCVPLFPAFAQGHTETPSPRFELVPLQTHQFNFSADFQLTSPSFNLNPIPDTAPLTLSFELSSQPSSALSVNNSNKNTFLLPPGSCSSPTQRGLLSGCLTLPPIDFAVPAPKFDLYSILSVQPARRPTEEMHWKAAFWQSFGFLVVSHGFRFVNDPGLRYLMFHKPFWHDYWASTDNFHMSRWGDGDDFLVNDIGHPMEGAVYGDIFINNDPRGRAARFGKSSNYWHSRLKAVVWATAWEAYFEIGPIFSEAAIGNEGGYDYSPGCGITHPCPYDPAHPPKGTTNNTGWTDFVTTPLIGFGWIVMEDAIERELVDRIAKDSPALKYKILRGSLAPSHTVANVFSGKTPWFRYPEEASFLQTYGAPLHPKELPLWKNEPRYNLGVQFIFMNFPLDSESCANCKKFFPGYSFDFNYRFAKYAYFDSVVNLFPGSGSVNQHGAAQEVLAGFKLGPTVSNWGFFFNLRNGFIHYDKTFVADTSTTYESTWRYALDLGGTVEYYASRNSAIRFNAGTTLIHYLHSYADPLQPTVSVLSTEYYSFRGSPYLTTGYVFRF